MTLTVGSLFSGIGGIDLGLERAGMRVIWQSEIDPYASRVLAKHWPGIPNLGDIKQVDWSSVERPDIIAGGYPCQPFSTAGRRAGTDDERHLWPWFARALRLLRPRYALLENVPGHIGLGFDRVLADLAALGFDAEWTLVPAAAVGAPHLRYRLFVLAYAQGQREPQQPEGSDAAALGGAGARTGRRAGGGNSAQGIRVAGRTAPGGGADVADAAGQGSQRHGRERRLGEGGEEVEAGRCGDVSDAAGVDGARAFSAGDRGRGPETPAGDGGAGPQPADADRPSRDAPWGAGETVFRPSPLERSGRRGGGLGDTWAVEPDLGRVAHGVPARVDRLRCLGNAVVPQVAEYVGRCLLAFEDQRQGAHA